MKNVHGVAYGDHVLITDSKGVRRNGQVIRTSNEMVLVQILESTDDLSLDHTWARFLDQPYELALSPDIMGRVFNGIGTPRDGRPPIISDEISPNPKPQTPNPKPQTPEYFMKTNI